MGGCFRGGGPIRVHQLLFVMVVYPLEWCYLGGTIRFYEVVGLGEGTYHNVVVVYIATYLFIHRLYLRMLGNNRAVGFFGGGVGGILSIILIMMSILMILRFIYSGNALGTKRAPARSTVTEMGPGVQGVIPAAAISTAAMPIRAAATGPGTAGTAARPRAGTAGTAGTAARPIAAARTAIPFTATVPPGRPISCRSR